MNTRGARPTGGAVGAATSGDATGGGNTDAGSVGGGMEAAAASVGFAGRDGGGRDGGLTHAVLRLLLSLQPTVDVRQQRLLLTTLHRSPSLLPLGSVASLGGLTGGVRFGGGARMGEVRGEGGAGASSLGGDTCGGLLLSPVAAGCC